MPSPASPEQRSAFGRVTPQQKRGGSSARMQSTGHVVAMTGDGVNDALALKDADIGVAMGNGSPATAPSRNLVLLDGKFSHLPDVVAEGRRGDRQHRAARGEPVPGEEHLLAASWR